MTMLSKILIRLREIRDCRLICQSGLFDRQYYLHNNLDVTRSCMNPVLHYIRYGWQEGRNPSENFNTTYYLKTNRDVVRAGANPLCHYIKYGINENRVPLPVQSRETTGKTDIAPWDQPAVHSHDFAASNTCFDQGWIPDIYETRSNTTVTNQNIWQPLINEQELLRRVRQYNVQKLKRKARVVAFSAMIGNYDRIIHPEHIVDEWDYVFFSDVELQGEHIFEVRKPDYYADEPARMARFIKTHPHLYFKDYDCAVWIDSSILICGPHLEQAVNQCIENGTLLMGNPHPHRSCVFDELAQCISRGKDDPAIMEQQVLRYKKEGFSPEFGMLETGILIRKHNDDRVRVFNEIWWNEIEKGSRRDQLSVMYVLWKTKLPYKFLPDMRDIRDRENKDYQLFPHIGKNDLTLFSYRPPSFMKKPSVSDVKKDADCKFQATPDLLRKERVDIVVCVHNALDDVKKCFQSVLANLLPSHKIFIGDDGSDLETCTYLCELKQACPEQIQLIRNEKAKGYTKAANMGLKASDAPLVILLNSDTIVSENWALKLLHAAKSVPGVGVVGPMSNAASWQSLPRLKDSVTGRLAVNDLPSGKTVQDMDRLCEKCSEFPLFPRVPLINGFCYGIRQEVIDKIGVFDEEAFPRGYGEEDDFSFRAMDAGYIHAIATHCYVYHAKSKSFGDAKRDKLANEGGRILRSRYGEVRVRRAVHGMENNPFLRQVRLGVINACGDRVPKEEQSTIPLLHETERELLVKDADRKQADGMENNLIPFEQIARSDNLKSLIDEKNIRFIDFSCSHGSGVLWTQKKTKAKGLGFDINPRKLKQAAQKGVLCSPFDILNLPERKLVSFTTIFHML
ncbi:MAG: hypothetical protein DRP56_07820, partial [Planctomycetota bacterium]